MTNTNSPAKNLTKHIAVQTAELTAVSAAKRMARLVGKLKAEGKLS